MRVFLEGYMHRFFSPSLLSLMTSAAWRNIPNSE